MHIGILEDDPVQRELLSALVRQGQHSCRSFETAQEFLDALKQESFDITLIDWVLPESNGGEVLRWIHS